MEFRPMRRFKQQLPDEECEAILKEAYRGFLSVVGDGGVSLKVTTWTVTSKRTAPEPPSSTCVSST